MNNDWANDRSLTLRARGLMTYILTLPRDAPLSAHSLSKGCTEGRDAIRTALDELAAAGLVTRTAVGSGTGTRWVTRIAESADFPQSATADSKALGSADSQQSADNPQSSSAESAVVRIPDSAGVRIPDSTADFPQSGSADSQEPSADSQSVEPSPRRGEGGSSESKAAAALEIVESETREGSSGEPIDHHAKPVEDVSTEAEGVTDRHTVPWTEVHLLRSWFQVEDPRQVEAWQQAWRTATATNGETGYDVQVDLNAYLVRCRAERRVPSPSNWLRFLIQDRTKWVSDQRHHADLLDQRAAADGGMEWALRSLSRTPKWDIEMTEGGQQQ